MSIDDYPSLLATDNVIAKAPTLQLRGLLLALPTRRVLRRVHMHSWEQRQQWGKQSSRL